MFFSFPKQSLKQTRKTGTCLRAHSGETCLTLASMQPASWRKSPPYAGQQALAETHFVVLMKIAVQATRRQVACTAIFMHDILFSRIHA